MGEPTIRDLKEAARVFLNNTEERRRYINREMSIMDREAQMEYAREQGEKRGAQRLGKLISTLMKEGNTQDVARASIDESYREALYRQYGI